MISIWSKLVHLSTIMIMTMMIFHSHMMLLELMLNTMAWKVTLTSYKLVPRSRKMIMIGKDTSPNQQPMQLECSRNWTKKWRKHMLKKMTIPAMSLYSWTNRKVDLLLNTTTRMMLMIFQKMILHSTQLNLRKKPRDFKSLRRFII